MALCPTSVKIGQRRIPKIRKRVGDFLTIKQFFMKKYFLGLFAIVLALGVVAFTTPNSAKQTTSFFSYDPVTQGNNEDDEARWVNISQATYDALNCGITQVNGCKLKSTSTQIIGGQVKPALVNVTGVNKTPQHVAGSDNNFDIVNRP
mgnify:CR=1 FL=1